MQYIVTLERETPFQKDSFVESTIPLANVDLVEMRNPVGRKVGQVGRIGLLRRLLKSERLVQFGRTITFKKLLKLGIDSKR